MALRGQAIENSQEALRVLDIILRQNATKQGCLLVCQSFFHNSPGNFMEVGGGVLGCRGFHSSFRATHGGVSLNIDVSTTMIIKPGPVMEFLMENQGAKRILKSLRIMARPGNEEHKITGLSELPCNKQMFSLKQRREGTGDEDVQVTKIAVYDYFVKMRSIEARDSASFPCINVGKPRRPTYILIELCTLVSLQRYTKFLSTLEWSLLVEISRLKPPERMATLSEALKLKQ